MQSLFAYVASYGEKKMDLLYGAAVAWQRLLKYRYEMICGKSKKLYPIILTFDPSEFYHLAGFPHIDDIVFNIQFPKSKMLEKVLDGTITNNMISSSENYETIVKGKLQAIIQLEQLLDNCYKAYLYDPKRLPFYTKIIGKYLIVDESNDVVFLFADSTDETNYFSRSTFVMGDQDFRANQSKITVLKVEKTDLETGITEQLYVKDGFFTVSEETTTNDPVNSSRDVAIMV